MDSPTARVAPSPLRPTASPPSHSFGVLTWQGVYLFKPNFLTKDHVAILRRAGAPRFRPQGFYYNTLCYLVPSPFVWMNYKHNLVVCYAV